MAGFDLEKLMEGTIRQLQAEAKYFSSLTSHNGEKGRLNETHLVRTLRRYLPDKFGLGTGFIVAGGAEITQSRQCDIIIYDRTNNVPFYSSEAWQIYPIEMVYGVIEVKTRLNRKEIKDAFEKCAVIRRMSGNRANPNKAYIRQLPPEPIQSVQYRSYKDSLPPRFFVFGYAGPSVSGLTEMLRETTYTVRDAHIHGLCMLQTDRSVFANHIAYRSAEDRLSMQEENGLLQFLLDMPKTLGSMLPVVGLAVVGPEGAVRTGASFHYRPEQFDPVDLDHYKKLELKDSGDTPA